MNNFQITLIRFREQYSLSKLSLSKLIGVSDSCIRKWENGERVPSAENLAELANVMSQYMNRKMTMDELWIGPVQRVGTGNVGPFMHDVPKSL